METNNEKNAVLLSGISFPLLNQEDDYSDSMDGCTYTKLVTFDSWVWQEACRRCEIMQHPFTDLRVGALWHRNEAVIRHAMCYRYSTPFTPRGHENESNEQNSNHAKFDWDRDFYDIDSDGRIEWCDLESLAIATQHCSANIGGGKDAFTGNISEHVKDLIRK
ncbi:hypothetical protein FCIRC_5127 [Fusarium circinatum]|uniref:Uncharacterized protein n=1 Tax=Fusarium circinatum TaxID=48490 RepID=A0A8H5U1E4_FUSCI|nr:hypothetical protein FCIRC_5127 [Fusarium circinatum]